MSATIWDHEIDLLRISKRAKGRDRYNARRSARALHRQIKMVSLMVFAGWPRRGWQAKVARLLGVNRSTVCKDWMPFKQEWRTGIPPDEFVNERRLSFRLDRRRQRGLRW